MGSSLGIVTLDGPAGVGKSTLARKLASVLGIAYLDTGAMFRMLGLKFGPGAEKRPEEELREKARTFVFSLSGSGGTTTICCNGQIIGAEIRTEEVGMLAARIATVPVVREILKEKQREIGATTSLVAEGRDMGTVVFPSARYKFFLDARPEVRAERRLKDLRAMGKPADLARLVRSIRDRDTLDRTRAVAPLRPADDAIIVDTSNLDIDGVLATLLGHIRKGDRS